jgi:hypothetical protein
MRIAFVLSLLLVCQTAYAEESLCSGHEKIVFSCHVGRKIISLCRAQKAPQDLTYRYGTPGHLELAYPDPKINEQRKFYTSSSPLFGGEVTYLAFRRGVYEYRIYSKIGRMDSDSNQQDRIPMFEDGLVISRNGKLLKQQVCDDGGEGFREDIRWLPNE